MEHAAAGGDKNKVSDSFVENAFVFMGIGNTE